MSEKDSFPTWAKYMTPDGRLFLQRADSNRFMMARLEIDEYGRGVQYERREDGGFIQVDAT